MSSLKRSLPIPAKRSSRLQPARIVGGFLTLALLFLAACSSAAGSQVKVPSPTDSPSSGPTASAQATATTNSSGGGTGGGPSTVYVGANDGTVYSINAATGAKNWQVAVGGLANKPLVVNGVVYVATSEGHVAALGTGSTLWNVTPGGSFEGRPAFDSNQIFVGSDNDSLYALGAGDGSVHWTYTTGGAITATPAVAGGLVYTGSADEYLYAVHENDGSLAWKTKLVYPSEYTSPMVANGVVYIGDDSGTLSEVNATTGTVIASYQTGGSQIGGRPAVVNGVVFFGTSNQTVFALKASNGSTVWKFIASKSILSTPNVANGTVYIADSTDLYAINAANGQLIWHKQAGDYGTTGKSWPSVANGLVFMGASDGNLYAYNASSGHVQWTFHTQVGLGSPQAG